MISERYFLAVQCDEPYRKHQFARRTEFTGGNKSEAWAKAAREGWRLTEPNGALCPICAGHQEKLEAMPNAKLTGIATLRRNDVE